VKILQASQRLTWLKLPRDWHDNPRLVAAADRSGPSAPAGYLILLGRACQSDGVFADLGAVIAAVRADGLGLPCERAKEVAETLISCGLITVTDLGYEVTDWAALFRPPNSAITKMARGDGRGDERGDGRGGAAEQEPEPEQDQNKSKSSPPLSLSAKTMEIDGMETVILPQKAKPMRTHCSHSEPFEVIPAGVSRSGRSFDSFVAARHRLSDGTNCRERPEGTK
jgi:hypothetical protein